MKDITGVYMEAALVVDPHMGKTVMNLFPGEEIDVGQIVELSDEEILKYGLEIRNTPIFTYWCNGKFSHSECDKQVFENESELIQFISDIKQTNTIFCRCIRKNIHNNRYMICYHLVDKDYSKEESDMVLNLRKAIFNIALARKPKGKAMISVTNITANCYNDICSYIDEYTEWRDTNIAQILFEYESNK